MVKVKPMMISTQAVPPGGWHFHEPPIIIRGATYDKLVQLVIDHRVANKKPVGNPAQEIMDQIGAKNPHLNQHKPSPVQQAISFANALKAYIINGGALESKEEAERRASICSACHNNFGAVGSDGHKATCGGCAAAAAAGVAVLRKGILNGRTTSLDSKLKACQLCGCDLRLKIWFPKKYFDPDGSTSNKWPSFCWMK